MKLTEEEDYETIIAKNTVENYAYEFRNILRSRRVCEKLGVENAARLSEAVEDTIRWINFNETSASKEDFEEEQKDLANVTMPILLSLLHKIE
jgi:hypothetical protein